MGKTVFVTGGSGFTGGHLCRVLVARGYKVKALARQSSKVHQLKKLGVEIVTGDLSNLENQNGTFSDVDIIFHVAAAFRQEGISKEQFWKVNVNGTHALLEAAKKSNVERFVHCSTVGVQGEIEKPPAKESDPYKPGDHYQESKMEGELLALKFFKENGLKGAVVRPVGIYGPGDTRFLKLFKFINNGKFRMIGNGDVLYHLTFVEDLVDGIILAGENEAAIGNTYTIGGNDYLTLKELVASIAKILKKPVAKKNLPLKPVYWASAICEAICRPLGIEPPLYRRRLDFFTKDRAFDISRAKADLGYMPKIPLEQGLTITADWYKENKMI